MTRPLPLSALFPYRTLFRSVRRGRRRTIRGGFDHRVGLGLPVRALAPALHSDARFHALRVVPDRIRRGGADRKSTRLNSSHPSISYAVFCLKKKIKHTELPP